MKKKKLVIGLIILIVTISFGCQTGEKILKALPTEVVRPASASDALDKLKEKDSNITKVICWIGDTNSNGERYAIGGYSSKADFSDKRVLETNDVEKPWEYGLNGGSLEYFISKDSCNKRYEQLKSAAFITAPEGLNQYIFKYDTAIFRVSYDLSLENALKYQSEMDEVLLEKSVQYVYKGDSGPITAEEAIIKLKELNSSVSKYIVYTEESDPLMRLGRTGYYTSKVEFYDSTVKRESKTKNSYEEEGVLNGGILEIYDSERGCENRCKHIKENISPETVTVKTKEYSQPHQYIYKYKKALFRLCSSISREQAAEYKKQMDSILGEESEVY